MNYIFLSDIDGTLLRADAPLTAQVVDAARNYTAQGGLLAVCTGRSLPAVTKVVEEIGVNAPSIIYGGAAIYDFQKKQYLYTQPFRWDVMQAVRAVLATFDDISMQVFTKEEVYVLRRNRRLNELGVREENVVYIIRTIFDRELQKGGFSPGSFLTWAKRNRKILTDEYGTGSANNRLTKRKKVGDAKVPCVALVYDEEDVEQKETERTETVPEETDRNDGYTVVDSGEDLPF